MENPRNLTKNNTQTPSDNKSANLMDVWIRPLRQNNLKIWIHNSNDIYSNPSFGIGLGTKNKPNIFSFVVMDNNSLNWFEETLAKSVEFVENYNNEDDNNKTILWLEKREFDKLRKINISISVVNNGNNASIRLLINSKATLIEELDINDVNWIVEILNIAKYTLEGALPHV